MFWFFGADVYFYYIFSSVVDRHRIDANPDPDQDPTFLANSDPDLDPSPCFTHIEKSETFLTSIHISASLHCFIFLASIIGVTIFNILDSIFTILKFSRTKYN
jgi:hypothetical protein